MVEVHEARKVFSQHPEPTRFCPTHVLVDDVHFALNQSLLEVEFPFLYNHNAGSLVQHPWYYIYIYITGWSGPSGLSQGVSSAGTMAVQL